MDQRTLNRSSGVVSDDVFVTRFKEGDFSSFSVLLDRYKKGLYRMFYRIFRNPADAEDLTQEVFLKAYSNLHNFREESSFKTWLYRIAVNLSTNYKQSGKVTRETLEEESSFECQSDNPGIIDNLIKKEDKRMLRKAMESLPPKQRLTLSLRLERDLKNREIAQIMDCPIGTVKANLFHAINHIRQTLKENGYDFQ